MYCSNLTLDEIERISYITNSPNYANINLAFEEYDRGCDEGRLESIHEKDQEIDDLNEQISDYIDKIDVLDKKVDHYKEKISEFISSLDD